MIKKLLAAALLLAPGSLGAKPVESAHFRFYASPDAVFISTYALTALEAAYARVGAALECYPKEKVTVEVYDTKPEFAKASTLGDELLEKSGTVGICKFGKLMIISPRALPVGYSWLDTLAHEYTHFLVNIKSNGNCPLWLHEGLARYHDTLWRLDAPAYLSPAGESQLAAALKAKKLISFKRMHPSLVYLRSQDEISLAFAEVAVAVKYMREAHGRGAVVSLLSAMAAGGSESRAFKDVFKVSPSKFEDGWKAYLASLKLKEAKGALSDQPQFKKPTEEEFTGADLKGLIRLGDRMREIGRFDAALFQYGKALEQEPGNPFILLKTARALAGAGDASKAGEKLQAAIDANPGYVTPYEALGELRLKQGRFGEAASALESAVAINPFNPSTHELLSAALTALGRGEAAAMEAGFASRLKMR